MAKDEFENRATKECALKAQAKAPTDMATATLKKTQIMEDQSIIVFFMILEKPEPDSNIL
jgi:hypothetical protein